MKDISELNPHNYKTNQAIDENLKILFERLLEFQDACGIDFVITSGLRSNEKQEELIKQGRTTASRSYHLAGAAADILDKDESLTNWIKSNIGIMEKIGFWLEDFNSIKTMSKKLGCDVWVHVQIKPPKSGKRVFIP